MESAPAVDESNPHLACSGLLAYCRPGFEGECAQEIAAHADQRGIAGFVRADRGSGFVEFVYADADAPAHANGIAWRELVFARQLLRTLGRVERMPREDRLAALLPIIEATGARWCDAWIEAPDSDAARELASLCRALNAALVA